MNFNSFPVIALALATWQCAIATCFHAVNTMPRRTQRTHWHRHRTVRDFWLVFLPNHAERSKKKKKREKLLSLRTEWTDDQNSYDTCRIIVKI